MGQFGASTILGVGRFPAYGEPDHWFAIRSVATAAMPLRMIVAFPNGRARFDSPTDAVAYLGHPGDVKHAAAHYLKLVRESAQDTKLESH